MELTCKQCGAKFRAAVQTPLTAAVRVACPKCGTLITASQNIPVVSWLLLRGRCASCQAKISARYPIIELITGRSGKTLADRWRETGMAA